MYALGVCGYEVCTSCMETLKTEQGGRLVCPACRDRVFWTTTPVRGLPGCRTFSGLAVETEDIRAFVREVRKPRVATDAVFAKHAMKPLERYAARTFSPEVTRAAVAAFVSFFDAPLPANDDVLAGGLRVAALFADKVYDRDPTSVYHKLVLAVFRVLKTHIESAKLVQLALQPLTRYWCSHFDCVPEMEQVAPTLARIVREHADNSTVASKASYSLQHTWRYQALPLVEILDLWKLVDVPTMATTAKSGMFALFAARIERPPANDGTWWKLLGDLKQDAVRLYASFCADVNTVVNRALALTTLAVLAKAPGSNELLAKHFMLWYAQVDTPVSRAAFCKIVKRMLRFCDFPFPVDSYVVVASCLADVVSRSPTPTTDCVRQYAKGVRVLTASIQCAGLDGVSEEARVALLRTVAETCVPPMLEVWQAHRTDLDPVFTVPCMQALLEFSGLVDSKMTGLDLVQACTPLVVASVYKRLPFFVGKKGKVYNSVPMAGLRLLEALVQLPYPREVLLEDGLTVLRHALDEDTPAETSVLFLGHVLGIVLRMCESMTPAVHRVVVGLVSYLRDVIVRVRSNKALRPKTPTGQPDLSVIREMWAYDFVHILGCLVVSTDTPQEVPGCEDALLYVKRDREVMTVVRWLDPEMTADPADDVMVRKLGWLTYACFTCTTSEDAVWVPTQVVRWWTKAHLTVPDDEYVLWCLLRVLSGYLDVALRITDRNARGSGEATELRDIVMRALELGHVLRGVKGALDISPETRNLELKLRRVLRTVAALAHIGPFPCLAQVRTSVLTVMRRYRDNPDIVDWCLECFPFTEHPDPHLLVDVQPADARNVMQTLQGFHKIKLKTHFPFESQVGACAALLHWCVQNGLLRDVLPEVEKLVVFALEHFHTSKVVIRCTQLLQTVRGILPRGQSTITKWATRASSAPAPAPAPASAPGPGPGPEPEPEPEPEPNPHKRVRTE